MNFVLKTKGRYLVSVSPEELAGISNALNAVCNGMDIADAEVQTRLGHPRTQLVSILQEISEAFASADSEYDVTQAWSDGGSVQVRAISVFGDPVDMGTDQALSFAELITRCAREADGA